MVVQEHFRCSACINAFLSFSHIWTAIGNNVDAEDVHSYAAWGMKEVLKTCCKGCADVFIWKTNLEFNFELELKLEIVSMLLKMTHIQNH